MVFFFNVHMVVLIMIFLIFCDLLAKRSVSTYAIPPSSS